MGQLVAHVGTGGQVARDIQMKPVPKKKASGPTGGFPTLSGGERSRASISSWRTYLGKPPSDGRCTLPQSPVVDCRVGRIIWTSPSAVQRNVGLILSRTSTTLLERVRQSSTTLSPEVSKENLCPTRCGTGFQPVEDTGFKPVPQFGCGRRPRWTTDIENLRGLRRKLWHRRQSL